MNESMLELTEKALALPVYERASLAQALWQSLGEPMGREPHDEAAILAEVERRDLELESGAVEGRTLEDVMKAARRAIECD